MRAPVGKTVALACGQPSVGRPHPRGIGAQGGNQGAFMGLPALSGFPLATNQCLPKVPQNGVTDNVPPPNLPTGTSHRTNLRYPQPPPVSTSVTTRPPMPIMSTANDQQTPPSSTQGMYASKSALLRPITLAASQAAMIEQPAYTAGHRHHHQVVTYSMPSDVALYIANLHERVTRLEELIYSDERMSGRKEDRKEAFAMDSTELVSKLITIIVCSERFLTACALHSCKLRRIRPPVSST